MPRFPRLVLAAAALLAAACTREPAGPAPSPGDAPIRRLTRFEYDNTVRDLLGDDSRPAQSFAPDETALGFDNQAASQSVTALGAEQYLAAAEQLASRAADHLDTLLPCDPQAIGEDACARAFIAAFGRRAFRRPLDDEARARFFDLFASSRDQWGFRAGIELVVEAMLQSPRFLYRVEFGMPDPVAPGVVALDHHEIASRLSYLFWASMPDDALFAAADAGQLGTSAEIAAQAERMLKDPRARPAIARFHEEWLGLDRLDGIVKDTGIYPAFSDELPPLWKKETLAFLEDVVFDDERGDVATMLTASWSMANADLASFYGLSAPPLGADFARVDLDPAQRSGFLTHASILAAYAKPNQSSPVHRGKFVREKLLCEPLPAPPADMAIAPPPLDPHATTRQKFLQHSADPVCAECHQLMDGIGLGFEHYDGIGLYRDLDHGLPVDARGDVTGSRDADGRFDGVPQLAARLAASGEVRDCIVTQWFRYAYGRAESSEDACSLTTLKSTFAAANGRIDRLLAALVQTDAFRYRKQIRP
jgi:hypothetical protein